MHPFTCSPFHVLLNSLFKVLCNFPSRYLFAIGLMEVFSLSRSVPAALVCTLKQTDSDMEQRTTFGSSLWAFHPLREPLSGGLTMITPAVSQTITRSTVFTLSGRDLCDGLVPFHSPLLGESLLFSFPPLNDMLKFSGYFRLIRGRGWVFLVRPDERNQSRLRHR